MTTFLNEQRKAITLTKERGFWAPKTLKHNFHEVRYFAELPNAPDKLEVCSLTLPEHWSRAEVEAHALRLLPLWSHIYPDCAVSFMISLALGKED